MNGEPYLIYNLRTLYPFAHQIIVVEGACPSAKAIATIDGHSTDKTLSVLRQFKKEEDKDGKLIIVTAEDDGHKNGFWNEKDEMSVSYARRATGNYIWQIDVDEFYQPEAISAVIKIIENNPSITRISFPMITFWGGLEYKVDGFFLRQFIVHRIFSWRTGFRYISHRPPTVCDENGDIIGESNIISDKEMKRFGIYLYHYELLLPKQVHDKCTYYKNVKWTNMLSEVDKWYQNSYLKILNPFRVHMIYEHLSWLEKFENSHPPEIIKMMQNIRSGCHQGIEIRQSDDIELLLSSYYYKTIRMIFKYFVPVNNYKNWLIKILASVVHKIY